MAHVTPVSKEDLEALMDTLAESMVGVLVRRSAVGFLAGDEEIDSLEIEEYIRVLTIESRDCAQLAITLTAARDLVRQRVEIAKYQK